VGPHHPLARAAQAKALGGRSGGRGYSRAQHQSCAFAAPADRCGARAVAGAKARAGARPARSPSQAAPGARQRADRRAPRPAWPHARRSARGTATVPAPRPSGRRQIRAGDHRQRRPRRRCPERARRAQAPSAAVAAAAGIPPLRGRIRGRPYRPRRRGRALCAGALSHPTDAARCGRRGPCRPPAWRALARLWRAAAPRGSAW